MAFTHGSRFPPKSRQLVRVGVVGSSERMIGTARRRAVAWISLAKFADQLT